MRALIVALTAGCGSLPPPSPLTFELLGRHAVLECEDCHDVEPFGALPTTCQSCHEHSSGEANHEPPPCSECHCEDSWFDIGCVSGSLPDTGDTTIINPTGEGCAVNCHGLPPISEAHGQHEDPDDAAAVACTDCHPQVDGVSDPGHNDGINDVVFSGVAVAQGAVPSYAGNTCSGTWCHGGALPLRDGVDTAPTWDGPPTACVDCHGMPPADPHPQLDNCEGCHLLSGPYQTVAIPQAHIDGVLDYPP